MEKTQLFEFAVLWHPTAKQAEKGKKTEVIVQPQTLVADNERSAFILAANQIPKKYLSNGQLSQIEVLLRSF